MCREGGAEGEAERERERENLKQAPRTVWSPKWGLISQADPKSRVRHLTD